MGREVELPLPLAWLRDGVQDCIDGSDEADIWPTCGEGTTLRHVTNSSTCENVFLCRWDDPGYVELHKLCDGVEICGNKNKICSVFRGFRQFSTTVRTTDRGLVKQLSLCLDGLENVVLLTGIPCSSDSFIFPDHEYFGVETKTTVSLPNGRSDCDHMFGELYLYTSCTDKCINSTCPLKTLPKYEVCPEQYPNRIGTIANHNYLVFFTKSYGDLYTNRYFVCENERRCIDYSQVCDLVDDCGDDSDEKWCTNHFKCKSSGHYITKTKMCDGNLDCLDLSDECNDHCSKQILANIHLKRLSWAIGSLAVFANLIIIAKSIGTLKNCRTSVALVNKSLIILISSGDLLVGLYLFIIAILDGIIFEKDYCLQEIAWKTSVKCSLIGAFSTIGSQISLFSMTGLSIIRISGIWNKMKIPGEITALKLFQVVMGMLAIVIASFAIAVTPIIERLEDFFVDGVHFAEKLEIFIGTPDKQHILASIEAYHGRMKETTLSWNMTIKMVREMFSHQSEYVDYTNEVKKVGFYGDDGVCLFKYFVKDNDPQREFVWTILSINFACFFFISISYLLIGTISYRSSKSLSSSQENPQVSQRNRKMNRKIAIIISTDFICWMPFIVICILHTTETLDATPWYSFFSMIILPINSVINPFLYDDIIIETLRVSFLRLSSRMSVFLQIIRKRSSSVQPEVLNLERIG